MTQAAVPTATGGLKVTRARITAMPRSMFDPMPEVYVTTQDGVEHRLWSYYPDEISFTENEFVGLTLDAARNLKFQKDRAYLRS